MRVRFSFVLCTVLCVLLSGTVSAAAESGNAASSAEAAKAEANSKETAKPEQKIPEAKPGVETAEKKVTPIAPVAAGDVCAIQATEQQAQIQALQAQIDALKNQIAVQQGGLSEASQGKVLDLAIRTKNLPPGNYRERCFACLTMPDEDGERILACTCPVGESGFDRPMVNLSSCKAGQEVSYCGGMLVCGTCLINQGVGSEPPSDEGEGLEKLHKKSTGKK